jgi:hypothetical protein
MAQIKWLPIVAAILAFALVLSAFLGTGQTKACLWAVIATTIAVCVGLTPVVYSVFYKPSMYPLSVLAAGVIRLLITAGGAVIILIFVEVGVLWFAAWLGFFYIVVLAVEVYSAIRTLNRQNQTSVS